MEFVCYIPLPDGGNVSITTSLIENTTVIKDISVEGTSYNNAVRIAKSVNVLGYDNLELIRLLSEMLAELADDCEEFGTDLSM